MERAKTFLIKSLFVIVLSVPVCSIVFGLSVFIVWFFGITSKSSLYKPLTATTAALCLLGSYQVGIYAYERYTARKQRQRT